MLDVGTGGGFPGIPVAVARPDVQAILVDRTEKKVLFLKAERARLGLPKVEPLHLRLEGHPEAEGIAPVDLAVSRALMAPAEWFRLARPYVASGGSVVAMLGSEIPALDALAEGLGATPDAFELRSYQLPSGARRALLTWRP
jgi:16S rRNA (guanine527-N7)-methyltransferase